MKTNEKIREVDEWEGLGEEVEENDVWGTWIGRRKRRRSMPGDREWKSEGEESSE